MAEKMTKRQRVVNKLNSLMQPPKTQPGYCAASHGHWYPESFSPHPEGAWKALLKCMGFPNTTAARRTARTAGLNVFPVTLQHSLPEWRLAQMQRQFDRTLKGFRG